VLKIGLLTRLARVVLSDSPSPVSVFVHVPAPTTSSTLSLHDALPI